MSPDAQTTLTKQERTEASLNRVATKWLEAAKGRQVTVRWLDSGESTGRLQGWDRYTYLLEIDGKSVLVHKHAVASLAPA